jgi:hypothetical protein
MIVCIFTCPMTGQEVRATAPDDLIGPDTTIVPLECPICRRPHLVRVDTIEREARPNGSDTD